MAKVVGTVRDNTSSFRKAFESYMSCKDSDCEDDDGEDGKNQVTFVDQGGR